MCSKLLPNLQRGNMPRFCILLYANYTLLATQKGGPWPNSPPPLNTPMCFTVQEVHETARLDNGSCFLSEVVTTSRKAVIFLFLILELDPTGTRTQVYLLSGRYSVQLMNNYVHYMKTRNESIDRCLTKHSASLNDRVWVLHMV